VSTYDELSLFNSSDESIVITDLLEPNATNSFSIPIVNKVGRILTE